jgi:hypothetical protein
MSKYRKFKNQGPFPTDSLAGHVVLKGERHERQGI